MKVLDVELDTVDLSQTPEGRVVGVLLKQATDAQRRSELLIEEAQALLTAVAVKAAAMTTTTKTRPSRGKQVIEFLNRKRRSA